MGDYYATNYYCNILRYYLRIILLYIEIAYLVGHSEGIYLTNNK